MAVQGIQHKIRPTQHSGRRPSPRLPRTRAWAPPRPTTCGRENGARWGTNGGPSRALDEWS
eukprot:4149189-Pleurochrysis_carterae.AAC.2